MTYYVKLIITSFIIYCHFTSKKFLGVTVNWNNKNWEEEDKLFYPKRKVDNKISWHRPHIIGSFYSNKMEKIIEYHSLNECIFYFFIGAGQVNNSLLCSTL